MSNYILELVITHTVLIFAYWIFLSRDNQYHYLRLYLIGSTLLSLLIPLFRLPKLFDSHYQVAPKWSEEMILSSSTLTGFINKLPAYDFIRIHKSYVVNRHKIKQVEGNQITLQSGDVLPIGKSFRKDIGELF